MNLAQKLIIGAVVLGALAYVRAYVFPSHEVTPYEQGALDFCRAMANDPSVCEEVVEQWKRSGSQ